MQRRHASPSPSTTSRAPSIAAPRRTRACPGDVRPGDAILIDDGRLSCEATEVTDTDVVTEVVVGGAVSNNKGINLPGVAVSVPAMSEKDTEDLRWALRNGIDMVALSFVRSATDIELVHQVMDEEGRRVPVIAKLEKPQAVDNLDEIIDAFDAFMVARGISGWSCRWRRCRWCRRRSSPRPGAGPSR